jgi:general stress protein YciG
MMNQPANQHSEKATQPKSKRGFAAMSPEQRRAIAAKGGKTAHEKGKAFKFDSEKAREAGKIGGRSVSGNKDHMAEIGRKGGEASAKAKGYTVIVLKERARA